VRRLTRPVYARIITDPESYEGFSRINVGDPAISRSAREVTQTARRLWQGYPETLHTPVVIEEESGELISFATIRRKPFGVEQFCPVVDITAIGRDVAYGGVLLRDGRTSCGEAALIAALEAVGLAFDGEQKPRVWARLLRDNDPSHRIFENLNFRLCPPWQHPIEVAPGQVILASEDQVIRRLPYGEPLPYPLDADAYIPPEKPEGEFLFPLERGMHFSNPPALGRNDPCPCGSGKKYKKCCLP
jgi:RimJ/RimL family protein N-acetyltransferase